VYVNKIGNVSYYVAKRYLGLVSDNVWQYTSSAISIATNPTFTDTGLNANIKYTYVFVATDVNGNSNNGGAVTPRGGNGDGSIYTLADPSGLILTYNGAGSAISFISFTYAGSATQTYSSLMIYDSANKLLVTPAPTYTTSIKTYTSFGPIAGVIITADTIYTYNVYVVNAAGLGNNISVCMKQIQTCTACYPMVANQANSTNGQFCVPDTLGTIWNSSNNYSITSIILDAGTCYKVTRSLNGTVQTISEPQYGFNYSDLSTNLLPNTQYTFSLNSYNKLGYTRNTPISNIRLVTNGPPVGKIYTLADISNGLVVKIYNISTSVRYYFSTTDTTLCNSLRYRSSANNFGSVGTITLTTTPTATSTGDYATPQYNSLYTVKCWAVNGDGVGLDMSICYREFNNYTIAYNSTGTPKVAIPTALNSIYDINNDTITGFPTSGIGSYAYYVVTRTGGEGTVTSTAQTGTSYQDASKNLLDNTPYTYTYKLYNNDGYTTTSAGSPVIVQYYNNVYDTTISISAAIPVYTLVNANGPNITISNKTWSLVSTTTPVQKKFTFTCTGANNSFTGVRNTIISKLTGNAAPIITILATNSGGLNPYTFGPTMMNINSVSSYYTAYVTLYYYNGNKIGISTGVSVPVSQFKFESTSTFL